MESQSKPQEAQRHESFVLEELKEPGEQAGWGPAMKADPTVSKDRLHVSRRVHSP